MSSSLRRGALAAAIALPLALLAACGAGSDAQTLQVQPNTASVKVGDIEIQNVVVLTRSGGNGSASVTARIFNNGDVKQSLETLSIGSTQLRLSAPDGGQTLIVPAHGTILLGGKGNPSATVDHSSETVNDGEFQKVTFTFSDAGAVSVQAHVQPARGYYAPYGPSAKPHRSATESASPISPSPSTPAVGTPTTTATTPSTSAGTGATPQPSGVLTP